MLTRRSTRIIGTMDGNKFRSQRKLPMPPHLPLWHDQLTQLKRRGATLCRSFSSEGEPVAPSKTPPITHHPQIKIKYFIPHSNPFLTSVTPSSSILISQPNKD